MVEVAFSAQIREGTKSSHRNAESSSFMARFLRGDFKKDAFRRMLASFYQVYSAMEEEQLRHQHHPLVQPICFPALLRTEALAEDLHFFYGASWRTHLEASPARKAYVDRIRWVGEHEPGLLVAHCYTRYLGDLSGGQVLARIVRKTLELKEDQGMRFYTFDEVSDPTAFKNQYRRAMDGLPLDASQRLAVIEEARDVFAFNNELFRELDTAPLVGG